jgi:hypothetical protein
MTIGLRSDNGGNFFFDSIERARLRWADTMVTSLGEPKLELRSTKRDKV